MQNLPFRIFPDVVDVIGVDRRESPLRIPHPKTCLVTRTLLLSVLASQVALLSDSS